MTTSQSVPTRMKGFNRAEIVDQNFIEFVQRWQGDLCASPPDDEAVLQASAPDVRRFPRRRRA